MKLLFDFFPIIVFFICYKIFDIYVATGVAMAASLLQVIIYRLKTQRFEKMHIMSLVMILVLGGATLFHAESIDVHRYALLFPRTKPPNPWATR